MNRPRAVRVDAPAKINLGLELLGRRPDGYHEIRTVMAMIGLHDRIVIRERAAGCAAVRGIDLGDEPNLVELARDAFTGARGGIRQTSIVIAKHIPIGAGLGGASSDAAATLLGLNALLPEENQTGPDQLVGLAAAIGSDVPFFLGSPLALASGTGTTIEPLPGFARPLIAVLASPEIALPRKTATLYGLIRQDDFSDGELMTSMALALRSGSVPDWGPDTLPNPFRRAWNRLGDPISTIEHAMKAAGAAWTTLSGAGPTIYTLTDDPEKAEAIATRLREVLRSGVTVNIAPLALHGMSINRDGAGVP